MFKPLSIFLGWRYVRGRHGNGFSAFISASSTIGIALGVTVLIVVLSAMNGFERELSEKLLSIVPHVELVSVNEPIKDWPKSIEKVEIESSVIAAAPVIKMTGMLQHGLKLKAVEVRGVDAKLEKQVSSIDDYIIAGEWQALMASELNENTIVIGSGVATKLSVELGDKIQLLLPPPGGSNDVKQVFSAPITRQVEVVGIFKFGGTVDETLAYIPLTLASEVMGYKENETQSIRLKVTDVFSAPKIARQVAYNFDHYVYINNWTRTQGHLFNDIQLVRMVMFIVLVLVIGVASFNIVSTLIMAVNEKQGDIAILKTMGASSSTIMLAFIAQGLVNGVVGSLLGAMCGVYLALNLTDIISTLEQLMGITFLSGDVYFINYLPSVLHASDVYITIITALIMSLLATLYPAWRATKIEPAQVLGQL
ncbi:MULTISPECIES: lipoprotein-releasing ABC transporter permease subunit LolE [Colwellia]|jgi:lipoprotein-releasing system permease protein|uniref:Lipoprotein releasing system transmembrane protein LolE n=1 Tax=Colwellia psychrerythraea (strain 34H / ATCC BAA-681) TaxID=167879 RepID=Q47YG9_COLP3|nr:MULTISPECIES: lipoprotein-releasing ABC transporter permease subunit LolE [Colwellia]AAZ26728.1 lipoprotein releasing system transmembrane protein LolE [Colwellia psychrerythraea 34H]PKH86863.1 lipoprotein-releasing system transmembrane subunit LolC [Colwellia sp. Bg11-28]